jgi:cytochrome c-type biogenesis protein CcmF
MPPQNHIADLGQLTLLLALVVTVYAGAVSAVGARHGVRRLWRSGIYAAYGSAALLTLASSLIFFAILSNDYSIKYVHHYSDATMPWFYKLTSYWGGLDGSMMFWAWILSLFSALAIYFNRERHRDLIPWVTTTLMGILTFFLLLIIFAKRPFDTFLTTPPAQGKGLNPLLQNPYMATHPPSLYIGLVSCAVPAAFAMAALITGNLDDTWLRSVRRWVLLSWFFLSLGLTLGMLWAYEVLGWGGYWGWDPVENAGSLAWFTCTAFLHSIMIQERRGMLKVWNVFLVLTSFLLTMIATFLTRSGFVQSVHAFGSDPVLKVSFLAFIAVAAVLGYGLLIHRLPLLRSRGELDSWVSREFAFLVNNWVLLSAALFIMVATMFPSLSELVTGTRVTLAAPYYNRWMTPIGLVLLLLTGVGPLIAWRRATPKNLIDQFAKPVAFAVLVMVALAFIPAARATSALFSEKIQLPVAIINFGLCAFVLGTIAQEFYRGTRVRQTHTGLDFFTSLVGLVARNKRRYGGYLVHVGIVLMFVGFGGGAYKRESEVTLEKGQKTQLGRYVIQYDDLRAFDTVEKKIVVADLAVTASGKDMGRAAPAKWFFPHHEEEPVTHVEIAHGLGEDLYLVLNGFDLEQRLLNLKIVINPLVNWIWLGFVLLAMGTAVCFMPERAYALAAKAAREPSSEPGAKAAATMLMLALLLPAVARADAPEPGTPSGHVDTGTVVAPPRTPEENSLFHKIVCMCGTCGRELLADCTCGVAKKMRDEVSALLAAGRTQEQIIDTLVARFPTESPLAVPPDTGFNRMAWVFPYIALLAGAGALVITARRFTRRRGPAAAGAGATPGETPALPSEEMEDRLDDELSALD